MIAAIILAAGKSRRMGGNKLRLPWAGSTVIRHIASQVCESRLESAVAVVAQEHEPIGEQLRGLPIELVVNPDPDSDMLGSIRCGVCALPEDCRAAMIMLGDQPGITPALLSALIDAFEQTSAGIVVSTYEGRRGHPLVISMAYREELLSRYDGVGLRGLLQARHADVREMDTACSWVVEDLDTPADYARLGPTARPDAAGA